ncbi:MAG: Rrf2 family transcriptional regulator [Ruminiclostridium sp.]|nr:Rrf2 family transcriptional regulator [Ruminiclostridium sp.]MBQ8410928.1 Rrf2 family transcriptional regulator [Ruminiclostridium sp.]MBQ8842235.1 Rrf2 family transcriptional regulator [Ruminiclostridium sp.]
MHITLETDYAIRIVDRLIKAGGRLDAKTISERSDVPQRFALKILHKLVSGGVVKSYKGSGGGYEIALKPEELSLYDIVELVEGTYRFSRCVGDGYNCSCELPCAYKKVFSDISEEVCKMLKKQTFDKFR